MRDWLNRQLTRTEPARPLALVRITVGLCLLAKGVDLAILLPKFLAPEVLRLPWSPALPPMPGAALWPFLVLWFAAALAFTLGARARLAGATLVALHFYLLASDRQLYSNHNYFLFLLTLLLTVGESGAALALDARRRGERVEIPSWPATLVRVQMSIVYAYAALAKINPMWLRERALGQILELPGSWRQPAVFTTLAWATVAAEGFLAVALWRPRLRPWAFVIGFGFHSAIVLTMQPKAPLAVFSLASLAPYLLFLDGRPGSRAVAYDPASPQQRRLARLGARLDWLKLHRFRAVAGAEWEVRGSAGTKRGFAGVVEMLEGLPLSFLWAPVLRLVARRG